MTLRLLNGIGRFFLNFGLILQNESVLSQAAAQCAIEETLRLSQRWIRLAVMPVDDLKIIEAKQ